MDAVIESSASNLTRSFAISVVGAWLSIPADPSLAQDRKAPPEGGQAEAAAAAEPAADAEAVVDEGGEAPAGADVDVPPADDSGTLSSFLSERAELHGHGNYAAGWVSANRYHAVSSGFEFGHVGLGLRQIVRPLESGTLCAGQHISASEEGLEFHLDLAFASWRPTDWIEIQLDRAFFPLGPRTNVRDIGTLRPLQHSTQSIYGPKRLLAESLDGGSVGVSFGDRWLVQTRLFGGATEPDIDPAVTIPQALQSHVGASGSAGYWISRDFVIRLSHCYARHNRIAHEQARLANVIAGLDSFNPSTHALELGMSFMY